MFKKILIANRGEIAVRVIRACRELGVKTVAVYSTADRDSLHVRLADESVCIGDPPATQSYLNLSNIIVAATQRGADAIHPGYGFLAENAYFARLCAANEITFIGPPAAVIDSMGDKVKARELAVSAGVPVVPGSAGAVTDSETAERIAAEIEYPVMIKASAGGGGKGMRLAHSADDLQEALNMARMEAGAAFGNDEVYIEKYIEEPRHIEIQILADAYGNVIHLGERDCSLQRRNQKLLEESPSPAVDEELRARMGAAAVKAAQAAGYQSAGTIEFLLDAHRNFYFIEMNTRVQVEHGVSELVTGLDIVQEQIRIAAGERLRCKQEEVRLNGWAMECRINAEDPAYDFRPSPGAVHTYIIPGGPGVRVDSAAYPGYAVSPYYDSMIAKLMVWAPTRDEAIARMRRALQEFTVEGVATTIPFHLQVLDNAFFRKGEVYTNFIQRRMQS
ncbi:MAG: acetyl-CoA carboxylase biotin carboxylase subunit [Syntrophomonadaceae bacterium]|nr:acetyl-CoA carboxylase biotin carboxylase subunit [Syntrophomonadaceae bacterium]